MDDSCAVCAESLEWVAYGACGHRDVCSTCVARLRFVCEDRRCCICKSESDVVFITKAMGDYTRVINDFSVLPSQAREGRLGPYWYHEGVQAFFDDVDHYKMIKAMCRLSCSLCDKLDEAQPTHAPGPKRQPRFRNIDQLKGHLFHRHKLFMCSLCLEGRKIFICEQKLYTRAQLNQHISTGDSEVDGSESDRGGFAGHPRCEFCRTPFYGDNELYSHMSTEHYTCHICQRQHPGQYEYYKNYDDLEIHFRRDHFLCEDEACLEKKFIVFQSEAEIKRHNTMEHGGRMSRSKRSAALQIPTSFRYRRSNEQDRHRGRRQSFQPDFSDDQLSIAIQASLETANADDTAHDAAAPPSSSSTHVTGGDAESIDTLIQPFDLLATSNTESSARYLQALGHSSRKAPMEESSFPPLPLASSSSQQKSYHDSEGYPSDSMAARLRRKNKITIVNASRALPTTSNGPAMPVSNSAHPWPTPSTASRIAGTGTLGGPSNSPQFAAEAAAAYRPSDGPSRILGNSRINHSASSPNIAGDGSLNVSMSDFPPVAVTQMRKAASSQSLPIVEDVQTANKSLVEKIRDALGYDEDKYSRFKVISADYRQGSIDTQSYLGYVQQFGLWHLVLDLARLCPDSRKQKELVDIYNASLVSNPVQQNGCGSGSERLKSNQQSRKGKGKMINVKENNLKDALADSIISTVRKLQSSYNPAEEHVEELSKDGYRAFKGKSKVGEERQVELGPGNPLLAKPSDRNAISSASNGSSQSSKSGGGSTKQQKKTSKFHRIRLGDGSAAAYLDLKNSNASSTSDELDETQVGNKVPTGGAQPVRGAWRTGGSHKLFS